MSDIERVEWEGFLDALVWNQGEHVTMVGPTGSGKTTLALALLPRRRFAVALATKPKDATMTTLVRRDHWKKIRRWDEVPPAAWLHEQLRVVLWPRYESPADLPAQRAEISVALHEIFTTGGWCIFADELWALTHMLGQTKMLEAIWTQGRSIGLTLVGATQRPAHIPLLAYDSATHLFFWRDNDERNLKRIGGLNGLTSAVVRSTVARLPRHDTLYVNTRTGAMLITRAPAKG